jgi:hypothetical protein
LVQLQSSDFIAYESQKYVSDHALIRSGRRRPRAPLFLFRDRKPRTFLWSEERITAFCNHVGIKRREEAC